MKAWKIIALLVIFVAINVFIFIYFKYPLNAENKKIEYGATFSSYYSESLGLNWKENYLAILDDLKVKSLRIPAYWDKIELNPGNYNFSDLDWQINEAEKRGAKIMLIIGRRVPRWPECFVPDWAKKMDEEKQQTAVMNLIRELVFRYKNRQSVWAWQVENEPLLDMFGECPKSDIKFLQKEINLVKTLDGSRPVVITESGELSTWLRGAKYADMVGASMYFVVWNKYYGYFHYNFVPVFYYTFKGWLTQKIYHKQVFISEMQAEPWGPKETKDMPLDEQMKSMNPDEFKRNLDYVRRSGFSPVYFWGVEWWYWLKEKHNKPEFWETAKEIFKEN